MLAKVKSGALIGVDAVVVEVEVDMGMGLPYFNVVGLPEGAVKESKVRVASALKNSGFVLPQKRVTVNLAPADIRKEGAAFELPPEGTADDLPREPRVVPKLAGAVRTARRQAVGGFVVAWQPIGNAMSGCEVSPLATCTSVKVTRPH